AGVYEPEECIRTGRSARFKPIRIAYSTQRWTILPISRSGNGVPAARRYREMATDSPYAATVATRVTFKLFRRRCGSKPLFDIENLSAAIQGSPTPDDSSTSRRTGFDWCVFPVDRRHTNRQLNDHQMCRPSDAWHMVLLLFKY